MLLSCSFLINARNSHVCHLVEGVAADDNMKGRWCFWVGVKKDYYFVTRRVTAAAWVPPMNRDWTADPGALGGKFQCRVGSVHSGISILASEKSRIHL